MREPTAQRPAEISARMLLAALSAREVRGAWASICIRKAYSLNHWMNCPPASMPQSQAGDCSYQLPDAPPPLLEPPPPDEDDEDDDEEEELLEELLPLQPLSLEL
jgi:hypothetical protein